MTLAVASFQMTPELYRQQHADWVVAVSRWAKWAPAFAIVSCAIGLSILCVAVSVVQPAFVREVILLGLFFTFTGLFHYAMHRSAKSKWLKRANDSKVAGMSVEIRFEEDAIYFKGPTSESRTEWRGFERAVVAPHGFFLYTDKGVHVYVPDDALDVPDVKSMIVARVQAAQ